MRDHAYLFMLRIFLVFALAISCTSAADAAATSIKDEYRSLKSIERESQEQPQEIRAAIIGKAYEGMALSRLSDDQLENMSDEEERAVFKAANTASFYTFNENYVHDMTRSLRRLQNRGLASDADYADMFGALVSVRRLDEARALASVHPEANLPRLPEIVDKRSGVKGESEFVVSQDGHSLVLRTAALPENATIFVVSHPLCHFSQNAANAISVDPVLKKVFDKHSKWIAPQNRDLRLDVFRDWNASHPTQEISIVYSQKEWSLFDVWATPVFYFVKNGKVTDRIIGWPKEGKRQQLLAAMKSAGLLNDKDVSGY